MSQGELISALLKHIVNMIQGLYDKSETFLLVLTTEISTGEKISSILMVREFLYVFSEEVTFLPPQTEVKITVDLVP